jgi:hypothetical protein
MGEVHVPVDALYGAQTQRAVENFPISGSGLEPAQIVALAQIKRAAAMVNEKLGIIPVDIRDAIVVSADEIIAGRHHDQFPVDTYQTGSGTSSNMNINEVLGNLATTKRGDTVHPNDHVNASQSSNDVFPTSVHLAVTAALLGDAIPALDHLATALEKSPARPDHHRQVLQSAPNLTLAPMPPERHGPLRQRKSPGRNDHKVGLRIGKNRVHLGHAADPRRARGVDFEFHSIEFARPVARREKPRLRRDNLEIPVRLRVGRPNPIVGRPFP